MFNNKRMNEMVDTSAYDNIDAGTIKVAQAADYGMEFKLNKARNGLRCQTDGAVYQMAQLLFIGIWTAVGTVNSGWWWRYTDLVSSTINPSSGLPVCTGDQCTVYFLVWNQQYVPLFMACLDFFFLGVMFTFNTLGVLTYDKPLELVVTPMFWVNQSIMPFFTMFGAFILREICGPDFYDLNYISFFHPMRWISLYSLVTSYLTDARVVRLGRGNEVVAVVIKAMIHVVIMILLFSFTYFSLEWDPSSNWLQTKAHLDPDENFINADIGYFHNSLWSCIYITFVTLSTVGYGDYSPSTHIGRATCIMFVFWMLYYFPKLLDELSAARMNGLIKLGHLPSPREMKDAVVIFSKFDKRNISDFSNFLFSIESANNLDMSRSVHHVIAVVPADNVDDVVAMASRTKTKVKICVVKGDVAFGSYEIDSIFHRIGIEKWSMFRDIIFLGDFHLDDNSDITVSSRQNMSRIHSVRSRLDPSTVDHDHLTSIVYNNIESVLLSRTSRGNASVMSLIKAAAVGKSLTTCPGIQSLLFPMFSLSQQIENECILSLDEVATKDLSNYELVQRGLLSYVQCIPCPCIFDGIPFAVVCQSLYYAFSVVVIGVSRRSSDDLYDDDDEADSDFDIPFHGGKPDWSFWVNPCDANYVIDVDWSDLVVICSTSQRDDMQRLIDSRENEARATTSFFLQLHEQNQTPRGAASVAMKQTHSSLFRQERDFSERVNDEELTIRKMLEMSENENGEDGKKKHRSRIDQAISNLARPNDEFILILGIGRAWQDIIQALIQDDRYNIIHVVAGPLPDFEQVWVNEKGFDWSRNKRYYCISKMRCDKLSSFKEIGVSDFRCKAITVLPSELMIEEQEEGEDPEDTHVYATVQRLKSFLTSIRSDLRLFVNIENRVNTPFFSSLLECETRDMSQEVKNLDTLGPDLQLYSSRSVMSGNMWVSGMVNIMAYNRNLYSTCVSTKILEELLGLHDMLRSNEESDEVRQYHSVHLDKGVRLISPDDWKLVLPDPPVERRSYKVSYKTVFQHVVHKLNCIPIGVHRTRFINESTGISKKEEFVISMPPADLVLDYNSKTLVDHLFVVPSMSCYVKMHPNRLMAVRSDAATNSKQTLLKVKDLQKLRSSHTAATSDTSSDDSAIYQSPRKVLRIPSVRSIDTDD
eukprot:GHVH01005220.1.p1 GENE.GHVH01005220.1~~GHVH01005220.1.p1  ORF type:complete len:1154 (+),score=206.63 GHVH01005220.1:436-3897(+)